MVRVLEQESLRYFGVTFEIPPVDFACQVGKEDTTSVSGFVGNYCHFMCVHPSVACIWLASGSSYLRSTMHSKQGLPSHFRVLTAPCSTTSSSCRCGRTVCSHCPCITFGGASRLQHQYVRFLKWCCNSPRECAHWRSQLLLHSAWEAATAQLWHFGV